MERFLAGLAKNVHTNDATLAEYHLIADEPAERAADPEPSADLTGAELWRQVARDLDPKSTLLVEGGDSWFKGVLTSLPGGARFEVRVR